MRAPACPLVLPSGGWCELLPVLANFFLGIPTPLSAFLMIYICCVTDVCAGIALVYEEPEGAIMQARSKIGGEGVSTRSPRAPSCRWGKIRWRMGGMLIRGRSLTLAHWQGRKRDHRSSRLVNIGLVLNQYLFTGIMGALVCGRGEGEGLVLNQYRHG